MDITNFLNKTPSEIANWLQAWGVNVTSDEVKIGIPVLLFFAFIIIYLVKWINKRRKINKWRISQIRKKLGREKNLYNEEKKTWFKRAKDIFRGSNNIYIETRFQSNPPHDKEDPEENIYSEPSQNLMDFYLKKVLIPNNKAPFIYCILAGSGMGKTTFAINLLKRYINRYTEETKPYDIFLFSLSHDDVFQRIQEIESDKRPSSILILDAVDENNLAVKDYSSFKNELEKSIKDFAIVIVTCRTQFFLNEESEPNRSSLTYYSEDGSRTFEKYYKHYISVFDNDDIKSYLKKKYPLKKKRRKAEKIVSMCKSLMVRPLLLSGIDDLLQEGNKRFLTVLDIYDILIEKWLEREVKFWKWKKGPDSSADLSQLKESLYDFSKKLAVKIYQEKDINGGLFIPEQELRRFMESNNFTMEYSYKGRSLVNRDSKGNIKFAHKSFLEYFLAVQMLQDGNYHTVEGMDFMATLYTELCRKEFKELKSQGLIDFDEETKSIIIYKNINSHCFDWISYINNIFISSDAIDDSFLIWAGQLPSFTLFIYNIRYISVTRLLFAFLKLKNLRALAIISNDEYYYDTILTFQEQFRNFSLIRDGHFSSKKDVRDILRKFGNTLFFQFKSFDEILSLIYRCCKEEGIDISTTPIDAKLDYEELIEELKYYKINIEIDKLKKHNSLGGIAISIRSQIPSVKEQVPQNDNSGLLVPL